MNTMIVYGIAFIALLVVLLLTLELLFPGNLGLGVWERLLRFNTPVLPHNIVGCTARYAGYELINSLLICAASKYVVSYAKVSLPPTVSLLSLLFYAKLFNNPLSFVD